MTKGQFQPVFGNLVPILVIETQSGHRVTDIAVGRAGSGHVASFDKVQPGCAGQQQVSAQHAVEARYLANPRAADGDVRHALTALRFYYEYGHEIPKDRLKVALRHLLDRPEFAASAITDLARWKDWDSLDRIVALYTREGFVQPTTGRAIVGYLLACPNRDAKLALERLRKSDPEGVQAAQRALTKTTSGPQSE
jgi:hypothetical protein